MRNHIRTLVFFGAWIAAATCSAQEATEKVRYLRPADKSFVLECEFVLKKSKTAFSIESVTERGKTKMTVVARYDENNLLTSAEATLVDAAKKTATVTIAAGKARVWRPGLAAQDFDVPPGVIVTSAPDWTDTFLLCRRFDPLLKASQSFPGLWIHPEQSPQYLRFVIARAGSDTIDHNGKMLDLERCTITLRGNSRYTAWRTEAREMVKLVPLPFKADAQNWIVLQGYEKSTAALRPE